MIAIQNLLLTSNSQILECFNDSFSDYSIPFRLNLEQLENKLYTEDVDKEISVGAFYKDQLVGFVLHGKRSTNRNKIAYNSGTGVRPNYRGQKLTRQMYDFILPILQGHNIGSVVLEVISTNTPAIKSYQSIGFKHSRDFNCYKAKLYSDKWNNNVIITESEDIALHNFGKIQPSWQNSEKTIFKLGKQAKYLLAHYQNEICGYCVLNSSNNRIMQIAVKAHLRKKGIGSSFLRYIDQNLSNTVSIINVDSSCEETKNFFEKNNFQKTLTQKEMILNA